MILDAAPAAGHTGSTCHETFELRSVEARLLLHREPREHVADVTTGTMEEGAIGSLTAVDVPGNHRLDFPPGVAQWTPLR